ncbi:unnamed protein product [Acanthoscelides obtectus]|uniref:Uncharacterized protein n=1 Tax=Acanthoscelides obtectus TaxID=200917 RepID=A0A9P0KK32_ACAOB|nr:unnamed protein product [Acanthoscelides obtectus]CAK1667681.1 hypothetical protein AOBTE_LOCUS25985 [Acanthoscelides obtectus]
MNPNRDWINPLDIFQGGCFVSLSLFPVVESFKRLLVYSCYFRSYSRTNYCQNILANLYDGNIS